MESCHVAQISLKLHDSGIFLLQSPKWLDLQVMCTEFNLYDVYGYNFSGCLHSHVTEKFTVIEVEVSNVDQ